MPRSDAEETAGLPSMCNVQLAGPVGGGWSKCTRSVQLAAPAGDMEFDVAGTSAVQLAAPEVCLICALSLHRILFMRAWRGQ